jgi:hypothetical protein
MGYVKNTGHFQQKRHAVPTGVPIKSLITINARGTEQLYHVALRTDAQIKQDQGRNYAKNMVVRK